MGLIKLGAMVADASGKMGGIVFSKNRYGNYARRFVKPVNPNTARQQTVRSAFAFLLATWRELTSTQKAAWNLYGANVPMVGGLGDTIYLPGQQHFIRSNLPRIQAEIGVDPLACCILDGPTVFELGEQDSTMQVSASSPPPAVGVEFDVELDWVEEDGAAMLLWLGEPQNPEVSFFNGPYRYAGKILGNDDPAPTSPYTIPEVDLPFPIQVGNRLWCQARISRADGRLSEPFQSNGVVTA
jgi:hypothetical protein